MHESLDEFIFRPEWTTDCGVSCPLTSEKIPIGLYWEKGCLHFFSAVLDLILSILAGNDYIHESLDEFEIQPDSTTGFHGKR